MERAVPLADAPPVSPDRRMILVGVDTGGTFTDLALVRGDGAIFTHKTPSTPPDFERGVLAGVRELLEMAGATGQPFDLVHSTTVATNALLERKGAKTALIATEGFRDVLAIGRQNRPKLYDLLAERPAPLVPRPWRREVAERVSFDGEVLRALDPADAERVVTALAAEGVESLAVCLLFSFLRPEHERAVGEAARHHGLAVSLSSDVLPEFREYERTAATVANAYVSPVMGRYLRRLEEEASALGARRLRVTRSNGGSLSARSAGAEAVHALMSGPAAGAIGALSIARQSLGTETPRLLTFDMGGTSTDVALLDGAARVSTEMEIGGLPIHVPMIEIHTVGAGGGSIARLDAGGALRVGPESAGALPGPACYGRGGEEPTVTDANLLLGRLDPARFLGGRMGLDVALADRAVGALAARMGFATLDAARAIVAVANSNMERALRVVSVERGRDPADYALFSFGGAGGLHACDLAEALGARRVVVPRHPGVLSAWGALCADVAKDASRTVMLPFGQRATPRLETVFAELEETLAASLAAEGFAPADVALERSLDLRYRGQSSELNARYAGSLDDAAAAFHAEHERRCGHAAPGDPLEIVTARVRGTASLPKPSLGGIEIGGADASGALIRPRGAVGEPALYERALLRAGNQFEGPALIAEEFSMTRLPAGWRCDVDGRGNLMLSNGSGARS
jgi:N-methylhydantoinase A